MDRGGHAVANVAVAIRVHRWFCCCVRNSFVDLLLILCSAEYSEAYVAN